MGKKSKCSEIKIYMYLAVSMRSPLITLFIKQR